MEVVAPPKAVHFAPAPSEIPPRPDTPSDEESEPHYANHTNGGRTSEDSNAEGETAVALYDFTGDASDELSVKEGEALIVLDRSNDDWWKCRNHEGLEGVVPAQYVDLETSDGEQDHHQHCATAAASKVAPVVKAPSPEPEPEEDSEDERQRIQEEKEKKEREERKEKERKEKKEREQREREEAERRARAEEEERIAEERKKAQIKKANAEKKAREEARLRKEEDEKKAAKARYVLSFSCVIFFVFY